MKKSIFAFILALLLIGGVSWAYHVSGQCFGKSAPAPQKDTVFVNTTELASDVIGYQGPTPLMIKIFDGRVVSIEALPNQESPGYYRRVLRSAIFSDPIGKTPAEVLAMPLDAVTGATFTSEAVIENLRRGLKSVE